MRNKIIQISKYVLYLLIVLIALSILAFLFLLLKPLPTNGLEAVYDAATDYEESVSRISAYVESFADRDDLIAECKPYAQFQEEQPEKAIIFYHGYTSCPQQYRTLAQEYFDQGYSVFVPLIPGHGYADRLTDKQTEMTPQAHVDLANDTVNMAAALGSDLEVQGLSGGGVIATWIGMHREDVDVATIIAPSYDPTDMPTTFPRAAMNLIDVFPTDYYVWWDEETKENNPASPFYAYPRFSLKGVNSFMIMYAFMQDEIAKGNSATNKFNFIINDADPAIKNDAVIGVYEGLQKIAGVEANLYRFDAELGLAHDVVSIEQEKNQSLAYPFILQISKQS